MSLPAKGQQSSLAATRRSTRLSAAESNPEQDAVNSMSKSLPNGPPRRSARTKTISKTLMQSSSESSKSADSNESYIAVQSRERCSKESPKKQKRATKLPKIDDDAVEYILKPIDAKERQKWKGWCEVESEPAFFNVMLREFGVGGVKVQEVVGLDEELLAFLPKPVYGLIFLFQFQDDDPTKQEATCPDHIWFANQTTSNACASIALLNIVMNVPEIEPGPTLESLKAFTDCMNPALCGYQVCNHDYIRQVHNSFTRKIDILNTDLALLNDASAKRSRKKTESLENVEEDLEQAGFHFIAFVPIQGSVWKLDGLERQPMNLGTFDQDWMDLARPLIEERMRQYEGNQIQFNLLALCKSPLVSIPAELATNINTLIAIENQLSHLHAEWKQFIGDSEMDNIIRGPNVVYKLTPELLRSAPPLKSIIDKMKESAASIENLFGIRQELVAAQSALRVAMVDEMAAIEQDNERALNRRHDYTPMIHTWLRFLADNGALRGLVEGVGRYEE